LLVLFLFSHYLWFSYFTSQFVLFWDIMAFFMICVWAVPFIFFISLTTDDTSLPYGSIAASMSLADTFIYLFNLFICLFICLFVCLFEFIYLFIYLSFAIFFLLDWFYFILTE
jgi:hypothetical protein